MSKPVATTKRLPNLIQKLHATLKLEYPPHHYNHLNVWSRYWNLIETLNLA